MTEKVYLDNKWKPVPEQQATMLLVSGEGQRMLVALKNNVKKFIKAQDSDGVMVAFDIPDDVAKQLQLALKDLPAGSEPLPVSEMHVTLFYPGAMEDLIFNQDQLVSAIKDFCRTHAPLEGVVGGIAQFNGNDEKKPLVALFDCPDLPQFRQELVEHLHANGIHEVLDDEHGFIPHMTLAYIPADASFPDVKIAPLPLSFTEICVAWGGTWKYIPLIASQNIRKLELSGELAKHCGVCEDDDAYYGAPVIKEAKFAFPDDHHKNNVEIVAMKPDGLESRPALWKPEGGELDTLQTRIGGAMYPREEAAYLLDRSLNFWLVPVAYVADVDDEHGAVVYYSQHSTKSKDVTEYNQIFVERAGVLDYIMCQIDRHTENFKTHPDEPDRPVLIDNSLCFPVEDKTCYSPFIDAIRGKDLSPDTKRLLYICTLDMATWSDIRTLVGDEACDKAYGRAIEVLSLGMLPVETETAETSGSSGL